MENVVLVGSKKYHIEKSELHLVKQEYTDGYYMYLGVALPPGAGGFGLWEVELSLLDSIDDLDGKRIHVEPNGECYDDDTLGTDMVGAYAQSDLNYWGGEESYVYGEILVDFKRKQGLIYHVKIELTLIDSDSYEDELKPEDFNIKAQANFEVEIDENDPYS